MAVAPASLDWIESLNGAGGAVGAHAREFEICDVIRTDLDRRDTADAVRIEYGIVGSRPLDLVDRRIELGARIADYAVGTQCKGRALVGTLYFDVAVSRAAYRCSSSHYRCKSLEESEFHSRVN